MKEGDGERPVSGAARTHSIYPLSFLPYMGAVCGTANSYSSSIQDH